MRQKQITDIRREKGLDAVLVTNPLNVRYISGCTADTGCLYLSDSSCIFLTDSRYTTQAQEECGNRFTVCEIKGRDGYTDALQPVSYTHLVNYSTMKRRLRRSWNWSAR